MDMSFMAKFRVEGADAGLVLERLSANAVDGETGVITYTQWLNERGLIEADLTVTKLEPGTPGAVGRGATVVPGGGDRHRPAPRGLAAGPGGRVGTGLRRRRHLGRWPRSTSRAPGPGRCWPR